MYDKRMIRIWAMAFTFGLLFTLCAQAPAAAEAQSVAMRFYGSLADQNNEPVAGATVHALVYDSLEDKARPVGKITATTDTGGTFQLSAAGLRLDILSIKKQGHEFSTNRKKDLTWPYSGNPKEGIFIPDAANPVSFRIRKKNDPAFLVHSKGLLRFKPGQDSPYVLAAPMGSFRDVSESVRAGRQLASGLKVSASLSDDGLQYNLTFDSPDDGSGVITADELLHECPAEGYADQASMKVKIPDKAKETEKYAYVKTKGSDGIEWTYSRIDLHIITGKAELIINTTSLTNPDGSRNLEYDEKFQRRELARRIEEYRNNPAPDKGPMPYYLRRPQLRGRDWNFAAQRRRTNKIKREHLRAAEGKIREKKRTIK
ncbi:MAG: hypothetical protein J7M40_13260 [Planctomycetes bacterium]|nr:hypothetical protein [Planctomycetota bacterium]